MLNTGSQTTRHARAIPHHRHTLPTSNTRGNVCTWRLPMNGWLNPCSKSASDLYFKPLTWTWTWSRAIKNETGFHLYMDVHLLTDTKAIAKQAENCNAAGKIWKPLAPKTSAVPTKNCVERNQTAQLNFRGPINN